MKILYGKYLLKVNQRIYLNHYKLINNDIIHLSEVDFIHAIYVYCYYFNKVPSEYWVF